jgi:hypothetical protein
LELNGGLVKTVFDGSEVGAVFDGDVSFGCGAVIGIDAQMNLRSIVGLEPPSSHSTKALVQIESGVTEDID